MKLFALFLFAFTFTVNVEGKSYQLKNLNGRCLNGSPNWLSTEIFQSACDLHTTPWSYNEPNGSKDRHICDGQKCIASPQNSGGNAWLIRWGWSNEAGHRFTFKEDKYNPGYFRIVNDYGKCLSVGQNSLNDGAFIVAWDCNQYEGGQLWKWNLP